MTTPLTASLKQANPDALIDYLVFEGTEGVLVNNPHIRNVITAPRGKPNLGTLFSLFRKYDVALAAYPSDRTASAALIAGKKAVGLTYRIGRDWWKRMLLDSNIYCNDNNHVVANILSLLEPLGVPPVPRAVMGYNDGDVEYASTALTVNNRVILHPFSRNRCKYWPTEKWGKLAGLIREQTSCQPVFTRTPDPADSEYLEQILKTAPKEVTALKEPCSLSRLAAIIKNSEAFIGIDTVATHMAASLDVVTIGLFGPTLTRYWAPWPNGCEMQSPFSRNKGTQRIQNVTVVQKDWDCVPCNRETCAISKRNKMECLEELSAEEVLEELIQSLAARG